MTDTSPRKTRYQNRGNNTQSERNRLGSSIPQGNEAYVNVLNVGMSEDIPYQNTENFSQTESSYFSTAKDVYNEGEVTLKGLEKKKARLSYAVTFASKPTELFNVYTFTAKTSKISEIINGTFSNQEFQDKTVYNAPTELFNGFNTSFVAPATSTGTVTISIQLYDGSFVTKTLKQYNDAGTLVSVVANDIVLGRKYDIVIISGEAVLFGSNINYASETVAGKIQIATTAQTTAGVNDTSAVTPAKLIEYINTGRVIFSNNTTTPNTQLDYTAGRFFFSSGGSGKVSAGTLNFAINGAGGLDTGSFQANTTYHIFGITNFTSGTSSIIASLNLIPTLPSGYTKYKRVMSILSNSTPAIRPLIQDGIIISLKDSVLSYSGNINTTPTLRSVTVPSGIRVEAWGFASLAGFNINNLTIVIRDPYANSGLGYGIVYGGVATSIYDLGGNFSVLTNTSSQLYLSITGGSDNEFNLYTQGWIDNNI